MSHLGVAVPQDMHGRFCHLLLHRRPREHLDGAGLPFAQFRILHGEAPVPAILNPLPKSD